MSRRSLQYRKRHALAIRDGAAIIELNIRSAHKFAKSTGKARIFNQQKWEHSKWGLAGHKQCSMPIRHDKSARLSARLAKY